jgi:hypothetical protein
VRRAYSRLELHQFVDMDLDVAREASEVVVWLVQAYSAVAVVVAEVALQPSCR